MTIRTVAILLLRLWGLSCLIYGLLGIIGAGIPPFAAQADAATQQLLMVSAWSSIVSLVLGTVLLTASGRIADWIAPEPASELDPKAYSVTELQAIAFGAVGVWLLINGAADVVALLYAMLRQPALIGEGDIAYALAGRQEQIVRAVVQLIFAAVLLVNRHTFAAFREKLRVTPTT